MKRLKYIILISISVLLFYSCTDLNSSGNDVSNAADSLSNEQKEFIFGLIAKKRIDRIDSLIERYHRIGGFHGNVLVSIQNQVVIKKSFGFSDFDTRDSLNDTSAFQLASASKPFTAMSIMILHEKGKLNFDDDIRKYLPELPYENLSIRNLLNHQSGLPNYMYLLDHFWTDTAYPTNSDIVNLLAFHKLPIWFPPGYRFNYSNTNYALLAGIVERISGQNFAEFVQTNIFNPLGMNHSFVFSPSNPQAHSEIKRVPGLYSAGRGRKIPLSVHDGPLGDKGVYSTTGDLFLWDQALYTERLVSQSTINQAFTPAINLKGEPEPYGFGFRLRLDTFPVIAYHQGWWEGFRTSFSHRTNDGICVIVLNHTSYKPTFALAARMEDIISEKDNYFYSEKLIASFLAKGPAYAFASLHELKSENVSMKFEPSLFQKMTLLLREFNKQKLAEQADNLYKSIESIQKKGGFSFLKSYSGN